MVIAEIANQITAMSEEPDSPARPPTSRPEAEGDASADAAAPAKRARLRPLAWLGTLSTVVAVATGMFTLRDQILPADSGNAMASTSSYQQWIAHVCELVNQTTSAQPAIDAELKQGVDAARTALAQRNAMLSAWEQDLGDTGHDLAAFEAQSPPASLRARQRTTDRAWNAIITQERRFVEQLQATNPDSGLRALADELPALNTSVSKEEQTRSSGLVNLAGGNCSLSPPLPGPIVTLPPLPGSKVVATHHEPSGAASPGTAQPSTPGQPTPPVNPPAITNPPVNPPAAPNPPVNPPAITSPPVNPPASPSPPVNPPATSPPIHVLPGPVERAPSLSTGAGTAP